MRGEVKRAIPFSRRDPRPSYAYDIPKIILQSRIASRLKPVVGPAFGSIMLRRINPKRAVQTVRNQAKKEFLLVSLPAIKGSGTPTNVFPILRILRCGTRSAERARLSAFHHGACCSERTPQLSSSYALPGTRSGARPRWFERPCALQRMIRKTGKIMRHQRALPAPSCPSPAGFPADRSSCRPGVIPRSRPGAAVTSRRPREPLPLHQPVSPADVLSASEIPACNGKKDECQDTVAATVTLSRSSSA